MLKKKHPRPQWTQNNLLNSVEASRFLVEYGVSISADQLARRRITEPDNPRFQRTGPKDGGVGYTKFDLELFAESYKDE